MNDRTNNTETSMPEEKWEGTENKVKIQIRGSKET